MCFLGVFWELWRTAVALSRLTIGEGAHQRPLSGVRGFSQKTDWRTVQARREVVGSDVVPWATAIIRRAWTPAASAPFLPWMAKDGAAERIGEAYSARQRNAGFRAWRTRHVRKLHSGVVKGLCGLNAWLVDSGTDSSASRAIRNRSSVGFQSFRYRSAGFSRRILAISAILPLVSRGTIFCFLRIFRLLFAFITEIFRLFVSELRHSFRLFSAVATLYIIYQEKDRGKAPAPLLISTNAGEIPGFAVRTVE